MLIQRAISLLACLLVLTGVVRAGTKQVPVADGSVRVTLENGWLIDLRLYESVDQDGASIGSVLRGQAISADYGAFRVSLELDRDRFKSEHLLGWTVSAGGRGTAVGTSDRARVVAVLDHLHGDTYRVRYGNALTPMILRIEHGVVDHLNASAGIEIGMEPVLFAVAGLFAETDCNDPANMSTYDCCFKTAVEICGQQCMVEGPAGPTPVSRTCIRRFRWTIGGTCEFACFGYDECCAGVENE